MATYLPDIPDGNLPGSASRVNKVLRRMGVQERIFQGKGYVYFSEGEAHTWPSCSVAINRINHLTVRELIEEYLDLKKQADPSYQDEENDRRYGSRHLSSTIQDQPMTKQLLQAAKSRVQAADLPQFNTPEHVLKTVFDLFPDLKYDVVKKNWVSLGVYEWDDLDAENDEVKSTLVNAGFKFVKESADAMHFEVREYFVVFAPDMGVVMVGSL